MNQKQTLPLSSFFHHSAFDIWTSVIKSKPSAGRGGGKKQECYGIKKLRELILELAVRGLLVSQDPKDEPASELLKRIATEKAKLLKEGKIKKQKAIEPLTSSEIQFVSPQGWEWTKLQEVSEYIQRGKGPRYSNVGTVRVVSQKCVQWNGFDINASRFVSDESLDNYGQERFLKSNDLLWNSTGTGTAGRINRIDNVDANTLVADSHVTVVRTLGFNSKFLCYYISSLTVQSRILPTHEQSLVSGTTNQVELNTSSVTRLPPPLPPLAEQHHIVTKVDELMTFCDQLEQQQESSADTHVALVQALLTALTTASKHDQFEQAWQQIESHFDLLFTTESSIDQFKQTILQLAVMGKLVKQDPEDEPASELLKKVAAERNRLVKMGKLKKQKPLLPILPNQEPFKLPSGWVWSRIGNAVISTDYGISDKSSSTVTGTPVLAMGHIQSGKVLLDSQKYVPSNIESLPALYLEDRDLLYNRTNSAELVGKTGIFRGEENTYTFASYLIRIRTIKNSALPELINLNMMTSYFRESQIIPHLKQQCGQANVNGTIMKNMLVAIPPEAEQHRIVAKVDELMALCDYLKSNLQSAQTSQIHLADSLLN